MLSGDAIFARVNVHKRPLSFVVQFEDFITTIIESVACLHIYWPLIYHIHVILCYTFPHAAIIYIEGLLGLSVLDRQIDLSVEKIMVLLCGVCKSGLSRTSVENGTELTYSARVTT